jgi:hypothetical protein
MWLEVSLLAIGAALAFGEFYVWYSEILWHKDGRRDPRNDPPQG